MQLPFKYDDLLNNDFGLETISKTVREVNKKVIKEKDYSTTSSIEDTINSMVDWSDSEYLPDDVLNILIEDCGMFSQTFFDDIEAELDLANTYDSLFAETSPYYGHWTGPPINKDVLIKSHDCMWAGHCGSSEHKDDCDKALQKLWAGFMNPPKVPTITVPVQSSQQSLLKPSLRNAGVPVINMITPQTPPMSDDEDKNSNKTQVESGASSDIDEADQELREYFNSKPDTFGGPQAEGSSESSSEASESEEESHNQAGPSRATSNVTSVKSNVHATQNDHSYFKDKNSSMIMSDLGIDTPSDSGGSTPPRCESVKSVSEEEIDVVSVPDKKYPVANRIGYIPPTNPPYRGRRNMQRPLDSAMISGRRNNNNNNNNNTNNRNGVKIMLPAKRAPPAINYPPAKRRAVAPANDNNKGGRRTRQTRTNLSTGRRRSNNNQEVEGGQPDLEKRDIHNNMERQRREDLRDAFDDLRLLVPEVLRKDRAAKVVILREAAKYCSYLTNMARSMKQHRRDVRAYQKKLKRKVSYLRRKAAIENGIIGEDDDYEEDEDYENDEDEVEED